MFEKFKNFLKRIFSKDYRDSIKVLDKLCDRKYKSGRLPRG